MESALAAFAVFGYLGFHEWLRHRRRILIHRERLAAVEKGVEIPPLDDETHRRAWNVRRTLLLAGLIWISVGVGAFVTLSALLASPANARLEIPNGIQWIGLALAAIGVSHLVVYLAEKKNENLR
jgi:hypothetical protein